MNGPMDSMYGSDPNMYQGSNYSSYPHDDFSDPMRGSGATPGAGGNQQWMQRYGSAPYSQGQQPMTPGSGAYASAGMYNRSGSMSMTQRMSPQRPESKAFFNTPQKQVHKLLHFLSPSVPCLTFPKDSW